VADDEQVIVGQRFQPRRFRTTEPGAAGVETAQQRQQFGTGAKASDLHRM
jgi:hypothetical protein